MTGYMTAKDAASYLQISDWTLYRLVRDGHIRCTRMTSKKLLRFRREWLDDFANLTAKGGVA